MYFDDFAVGQRFVTRGCTLSEGQILDFAFQYDPQPFHIDKEAAAKSPYGGVIASGFQTLLVAFRMFYAAGIINEGSIGSPGMDELRWLQPVRPGDTLHVEAEVLEVRPSRSRADRGTVVIANRVLAQTGTVVMTYRTIHLQQRRPA
ncbi:MAG: MaoC family dehydratase [Pseudomonadota bacterium]